MVGPGARKALPEIDRRLKADDPSPLPINRTPADCRKDAEDAAKLLADFPIAES